MIRRFEEEFCRQTEASLALYSDLAGRTSVPPRLGWAGSPDFLVALARHIRSDRPATDIECDSGARTVIITEILRNHGKAHVRSLENSEEHAQMIRDEITGSMLTEFAAVIHAPLTAMDTPRVQQPWYAIKPEDLPSHVGLLLVRKRPFGVCRAHRSLSGVIHIPSQLATGQTGVSGRCQAARGARCSGALDRGVPSALLDRDPCREGTERQSQTATSD